MQSGTDASCFAEGLQKAGYGDGSWLREQTAEDDQPHAAPAADGGLRRNHGHLLSIGARAVTANHLALNTVSPTSPPANTEGYSLQNVSFGVCWRAVQRAWASSARGGHRHHPAGPRRIPHARSHDDRVGRVPDASPNTSSQPVAEPVPVWCRRAGHRHPNVIGAWSDVANGQRPAFAPGGDRQDQPSWPPASRKPTQMSSMRTNIVGRLRDGVSIVNELAKKVASINSQIAGWCPGDNRPTICWIHATRPSPRSAST